MENTIMDYSCSNVEAMVKSVKSNTEIINNMLNYTRDNEMEINKKLTDYAKHKKNLGDDQIEMYRSYVNYKQSIEDTVKEYNERVRDDEYLYQMTIEAHNIDSDYSVLHRIFEEINKLQVKVMEMLCGVISQANLLLGSL